MMKQALRRFRRSVLEGEGGYILPMVLGVLLIAAVMASILLVGITRNQQHVSRDRAYTESLALAEAGLNQFLWMVADGKSTEMNGFAIFNNEGAADPHKKTYAITDPETGSLRGTYTIEVDPPNVDDYRLQVKVTGNSSLPDEAPRTVSARIGRPSFSEYVLLVDEQVYIGGPIDRVWSGKTHSNTGIRIETGAINDTVTSSRSTYSYGNQTKPGIWSEGIPTNHASRTLWSFPVPPIDFNTVRSDFERLNELATGIHNLPYVNPTTQNGAHGWYIKLLPNEQYQVAKVTGETESRSHQYGGTLNWDTSTLSTRPFPTNGVIYVNDNVWIEGTNVTGRITIASSAQLNPSGKTTLTSIHIVGDLTYAAKDGSAAIGLIAQNNIEIPMYAPLGQKVSQSVNMEVDCAMIAQQGEESVNRDSSGQASQWGPRRGLLTFYGSISTFRTPSRRTDTQPVSNNFAGFKEGANIYDGFLLHNPPPHFPTVGSYQIMDWRELPSDQAVEPVEEP